MALRLLAAASAAAAAAASRVAPVSVPSAAPSLPPHPRLVLTDDKLADIKAAISTNADAAALHARFLTHADWILTQPPVPEPAPGPSGVLIQARMALDYALTTALAFRLGDGEQYLDRAVAEVLNLASWHDWNPGHFLDTAEASSALALTYDWLYPQLNATTRAALAAGLVRNGLNAYNAGYVNHTFFWQNDAMNWNCVCSAGGMLAALALQGDAGAPASYDAWTAVFTPSLKSIPACLGVFGGDGSWSEGVGYQSYAAKYAVWSLASLRSSLGNDANLSATPGFALTGRFPALMRGASGLFYDWADSDPFYNNEYGDPISEGSTASFQMFFGAPLPGSPTPDGDPIAAYFHRTYALNYGNLTWPQWGGAAESLVFFSPLGSAADLAALPKGFVYNNPRGLVGWVSNWTVLPDYGASSLHAKAGNNGYTHSHLDLGNFVFDLRGVRVIHDLGADK